MNRLLLAPLLVLLLISFQKNDPVPVVYPDGEVRLQRIKDKDGRVSTAFEYAPDGKLVSMKNCLLGRATPDETTYFYDGQGRLERVETSTRGYVSCISCDGPALKFTQTFEYNATGQVSQTLHRQENGTITARWNYEYDGGGRLVRRVRPPRPAVRKATAWCTPTTPGPIRSAGFIWAFRPRCFAVPTTSFG